MLADPRRAQQVGPSIFQRSGKGPCSRSQCGEYCSRRPGVSGPAGRLESSDPAYVWLIYFVIFSLIMWLLRIRPLGNRYAVNVEFKKWFVVYPNNMEGEVNAFLQMARIFSRFWISKISLLKWLRKFSKITRWSRLADRTTSTSHNPWCKLKKRPIYFSHLFYLKNDFLFGLSFFRVPMQADRTHNYIEAIQRQCDSQEFDMVRRFVKSTFCIFIVFTMHIFMSSDSRRFPFCPHRHLPSREAAHSSSIRNSFSGKRYLIQFKCFHS